ncbi:MAG: ABC transporter ATP-binding protein, partial [Chloroflexi bacterium]|nr:ABC transporter ATP-binding protein [Chloroflexota bacterium]
AQLCDRILVMHGGRILSEGTPRALIAEHAGAHVLELRAAPAERTALLATLDGDLDRVEALDDVVYVFGAGQRARELVARTADPDVALLRPGTLEDVFLRLTGRVLSE